MIFLKYLISILFCFTLSVNSAALSSEALESSLNVTNLPIAGKQISVTQQTSPKVITKAEEKAISEKDVETGLTQPISQGLSQAQGISFQYIFFRMLKSLLGIILLILVIAGLLLLFKRLSAKMAAQRQEEHKAASIESNAPPSTISEAVASFVRHRRG